ncbi:MAG: hypothetical protein K2G87_02760 [Oscillospiraceae bacterium]|nr:hypothetical protein [Oscillospiraceae bacterium]
MVRKKIILGIVILVILAAASVRAVYFNKNYAVVEKQYGTKFAVHIDTERILREGYNDWDELVKCTPSLKKLTKLEKLELVAEENMDLNNLSEMKDLNELTIFYVDEYCGRLETLPELPNLKALWLCDLKYVGHQTHFTLPDDVEYNFDSIETLVILGNQYFDIDCLKHFKNLKTLDIDTPNLKLNDEEIAELQEKGINVKFSY